MSSQEFLNVLSKRLGREAGDFLSCEVEGEYLVVRPRQYLGDMLFHDVHEVIKEFKGAYVSAGKKSHWRVPLSELAGFAEENAPQLPSSSVVWISTDCLLSLPFQARTENGDLNELAANISELGILQPILVRPRGDGNYEVVCGQRRFKAAVLAGLDKVPCIIREMNDEEAYLAQITENIQRYDLSDYEKARMLQYLIEKFGYTQEQLAKKLGKSKAWVTNHLRILTLEKEYKVSMETLEQLTERQARYLFALPEDERTKVIKEIKETGKIPSSLKLESRIKELKEQKAEVVPTVSMEEAAAQEVEIEEVEAPQEEISMQAEQPSEAEETAPQLPSVPAAPATTKGAALTLSEIFERLSKYYPLSFLDWVYEFAAFGSVEQGLKRAKKFLDAVWLRIEKELGEEWIRNVANEAFAK